MGYLKIFKVMVTSFTISCMCTVTDIIHLFNYPCLQRKEKLIETKVSENYLQHLRGKSTFKYSREMWKQPCKSKYLNTKYKSIISF